MSPRSLLDGEGYIQVARDFFKKISANTSWGNTPLKAAFTLS